MTTGPKRGMSLFAKTAVVVVAGIALVAACTLFLSLRATERSYVETLSISNSQVLQQANERMKEANDLITRLLVTVDGSTAFRGYLTSDNANPTAFQQVYAMQAQLRAITTDTRCDIAVVSENGQLRWVNNDTDLSISPQKLVEMELSQAAAAAPNRILYQFVDTGVTNRTQNGVALLACKALAYSGKGEVYGYAYAVVGEQMLRDFFGSANNPANGYLTVTAQGKVVTTTGEPLSEEGLQALNAALQELDGERAQQAPAVKRLRLEGEPVTVQAQLMPQWELYLVTLLNQRGAIQAMDASWDILLVCLTVSVLVLLAVFFFVRQIMRPLYSLTETMQEMNVNAIPAQRVEVKGGYEARQLAQAYNAMLDEIDSYIHQLVQLQEEKRMMELAALQMKIRPHFIYNTLTCIKWLIWQGENEKAAGCIDAFSLLLRSTIGSQKEYQTVQEEFDNLKNYAFLLQTRNGDQIQIAYYLAPAAEGLLMPKLILQPLVENAFFHAFSDRSHGMVSVFADRRGESLVCEVMDDGIGLSQEQIEIILAGQAPQNKESSTGIGIANVDARIKLLYGENYGVQIFSKVGQGSTFRVTLPVMDTPQAVREAEKAASRTNRSESPDKKQ